MFVFVLCRRGGAVCPGRGSHERLVDERLRGSTLHQPARCERRNKSLVGAERLRWQTGLSDCCRSVIYERTQADSTGSDSC